MHVRAAITPAVLAVCVLVASLGAATACSSTGVTASPSVPSGIGPATTPDHTTATSQRTRAVTAGVPITVLPPPPAEGASTTGPGTGDPMTTKTSDEASAHVTDELSTKNAPPSAPTTPPAPARTATVPSGTVVVIDPGHNGANARHPEIINKQVPAGFGKTKPCNTTGTATDAGYPEHRFNWMVATRLRDLLQAKGITVVMTRDSDAGVGPCVDKRADVGNSTHAAAVVSIHGDGEDAGVHGFVVMTASRAPAGPDITRGTEDLALAVRAGLAQSGFPISNALGTDGIWQRGDLGGLNLSLRPTVMVECGNMRNAAEAAVMSSAAGQQRYAEGLAAGVLAFLGR